MKIGDTVSVLDDAITGVITEIHGEEISLETTDGFSLQYQKSELVVMENLINKTSISWDAITQSKQEKEQKVKRSTSVFKTKDRLQPPMEVDLHINQLMPKTKGLSNHEMLTIQLDTAKRQLDFAISKRIQRVVFIHGVGEGVLRTELEYLIGRYENMKFYDANYQKYGKGATEVYIFQSGA